MSNDSVTLYVIVGQIVHGATIEDILSDYPELEPEDIQQAFEYTACSSDLVSYYFIP